MHRWRQAGCSYNNIAQQLNTEGAATKTGKGKWQCGNVAGVLGSKHTGRILAENPLPPGAGGSSAPGKGN